MKKQSLLSLQLSLLLLPVQPASSATLFWIDSNGGYYQDPANWSGLFVPLSTDDVLFDLGVSALSPYHVILSANVTQNKLDVYNDSVIFDMAGYSYTTSAETILGNSGTDNAYLGIRNGAFSIGGNLRVGESGTGTLEITDGGSVTNAIGYVGTLGGSSGSVVVNGSGSGWTNTGEVSIGRSGAGDLLITNGGLVSNTIGYIGYFGGSSGNVTVDGAGTQWNNSSLLYVGRSGVGDMTISGGASVSSQAGYIGRFAGSNGTATVTGIGSSWTSSGTLYVGYLGSGDLFINAGGSVSSTSGDIGHSAGGSGTVGVIGTGSSWTNSGNLYIGNLGNGGLHIESGGTVSNANAYIGFDPAAGGYVNVIDPGSVWNNSGSLYIGGSSTTAGGPGSGLDVENGATVNVANTLKLWSGGRLFIDGGTVNTGGFDNTEGGDFIFYDGTLSVDGGVYAPAPVFSLGSTSGKSTTIQLVNGATANLISDFKIGTTEGGTSILSIESGSVVSSANLYASYGEVIPGFGSSASGIITVDGPGSTLTNNALLSVGYLGTGMLFIQSGGTVIANNAFELAWSGYASGNVLIDGLGSSLTANQDSIIGLRGDGTLTIQNGGSMHGLLDVYLAYETGSTGSATVDGIGSSLVVDGDLYLGHIGDGALTVQNGGSVTSFHSILENGTVTVDGAGSEWVNTQGMLVGYLGGDSALTIQNGGSVSNSSQEVTVGSGFGSSGSVLVTGTGSSLNIGLLGVGSGGATGSISLSDGGQLVTSTAALWAGADSSGSVTVSDAGSSWTNTNSLYVGGSISAAGGTGILWVYNGSSVSVGDTLKLWSGGTLNLYGGSITTSSFDSEGTFNFIDGTLTVDGGTFVPGTGDFTFSGYSDVGRNTILYLTNGATGSVNGTLKLGSGFSGIATMYLQNGSSLTSVNGLVGGGTNPLYESIVSNVIVEDAGSSWIISGELDVGANSNGSLLIRNGGSVTSAIGAIGVSFDGGTGTATVDGAGSSWTNSVGLYVGNASTGSLTIQNGGSVVSPWGIIGDNSDASGSMVTVDGAGSNWTNTSGDLIIGFHGDGSLLIQNGGSVSSTGGNIGFYGGNGVVTVDSTGSNWSNSGELMVGGYTDGMLLIQNGGSVSSTDAYLGFYFNAGSNGAVTVSGNGSTWMNSGNLFVGGNDSTAGNSGTLTVGSGGSVQVGGTLQLWNPGTVALAGGTLSADTLANEGTFNFLAGTLNIGSNLATSDLGTSTVLNGFKTLNVNGVTTLDGFSTLTLDGGVFSTGYLVDNGGFAFNRGTFNLTSDNLVVGNGGLFGSLVLLDYSRELNVTNSTTIDSGAILLLSNGRFSSGTTINNGTIDLDGPLSMLGGTTLTNNSLVTGNGRATAQLSNAAGGEVRVLGGDLLTFTSAGNNNMGDISLLGGTVEFTQDLTNNTGAIISGTGNLIVSGGLTNEGTVALSGGTIGVGGDVNNTTGTIIVSGNSTATFFDDVVHNGTEFRVSEGSSAVFFGAVSGSGSYTGIGSLFFEGDLNPGNSPGFVDVEGDLTLGTSSHTLMELGGLLRGDEYDAFDIGRSLFLDGALEVALYDLGSGLFAPQLGDSFDLFSAETISGGFDLLTLAVLGNGLGWEVNLLADEFGSTDILRLSVVSASTVPVPPAVWLFTSGLTALIGFARRRRLH